MLGAAGEGGAHLGGVRFVVGAALADRVEEGVERRRQLALHLHVADPALAVARLQVVHLVGVGVEGVVVHEHRVALDVAGVGGAQARRVGVHPHHLALDLGGVVLEVDGVAERLAHLRAAVDADEARHAPDEAARLGEHVAEAAVEAARRLARHLDVRQLVLADGHEVCARHEDVGDLHDGVGEERHGHRAALAHDRALALALGLVERHAALLELVHLGLERRVALEPAEADEPAE